MTDETNAMWLKYKDNTIRRESDKAFRKIFGKYIKGSFLIETKYGVIEKFSDIDKYYDTEITMEKLVAGEEQIAYDICRAIVGCHSSNTIFLTDEERAELEKSEEYKRELVDNVIQNIKLRRYGSMYFRRYPIM